MSNDEFLATVHDFLDLIDENQAWLKSKTTRLTIVATFVMAANCAIILGYLGGFVLLGHTLANTINYIVLVLSFSVIFWWVLLLRNSLFVRSWQKKFKPVRAMLRTQLGNRETPTEK